MTTIRKLIEYYEDRYAAPPGALRDYRAYVPLARIEPGARVLDVGCGEGFFLEAAARHGARTYGVEIVERAIRLARRRVPDAGIVAAAGESVPFPDGAFDIVTCLGSLEHFADPAAGAREVARLLGPGGRALIVVPNRRFVGWVVRGRAGTEQQAASELLLDRDAWKDFLEKQGLKVVAVVKEPWHTKPFASIVKRLAARLAWRAVPLRFTYQFAFTCRRA